MILRPARPADIPAMLALKRALALRVLGGAGARGGFLLGSDAAGYAELIARARCWVAVEGGELLGFVIVWPDAVFRASEVWARRDRVDWVEPPGDLLDRPIAYVDQLAVRAGGPRSRRWGAALALRAILETLEEGGVLVATTVEVPVVNRAALPYLRRVGGRRLGQIDEVYPEVGAIRSAIWAALADQVYARVASPRGLAEAWVVDAARVA